MIVTIHQPDFLPWLGFFARWAESDLFVLLDDVQFLRRGWHHRDRIKTAQGPCWITVPIDKGPRDMALPQVRIAPQARGLAELAAAIRAAYARAPRAGALLPGLEAILGRRHETLVALNLDLLAWCAGLLGITTPTVLASSLGVPGRSTRRLVDLTRAVGGSVYLTGTGARAYLEADLFEAAGLGLLWQDFRHPEYPQRHGDFVPGLSVLDFLLNGADPALVRREAPHA